MIKQLYKRGDKVAFSRKENGFVHNFATTITNATFIETRIQVVTDDMEKRWLAEGWHYSVSILYRGCPMLVHESELKMRHSKAVMGFNELMASLCE